MAYEIKVKWKGKCKHHPNYSPERDPAGAGIKGGCSACFALHDAYCRAARLESELEAIDAVLERQ